jgi:tetratricopeptide (TPR) repeat protein
MMLKQRVIAGKVLSLALFLALGSAAFSQTAQDDQSANCAKAKYAFDQHDYQTAYQLYKRHIAELQKDEGAEGFNVGRMYSNLGLCLQHLDQPDEALKSFELSVKILTPFQRQDPSIFRYI